ncbi:MAG: peptide chain release factor N(5)-glutamine methyltransferase [Patescibacteria group bacterium]
MSILSISQTLTWGTQFLNQKKITSSRLDAHILLAFVLKKDRSYFITHGEEKISSTSYTSFQKLIQKRGTLYPVAYLTGHKEFYDLDFVVNESVLIPRPETELVIDLVLNRAKKPKTVLDIATGSGAIALTLAKHLPKSKVVGSDISDKALVVAKKNKRKLNIKNCSFVKSNLLLGIKEKPDILTANLPYLEGKDLKEKSIKYEPKLALFGGKDGTMLYEKLFKQIQKKKWNNFTLFLEIGTTQAKQITKLAEDILRVTSIQTHKDLAKEDRVIEITL